MRTPFGSPTELLTGLRLLTAAGVVAPVRPDRAATFPLAYLRYRFTPATAYAIGARRHPHRLAVVDDRGTLTFDEIRRRTDRLALAFLDRGFAGPGRIGLVCRNHRTPVEVLIAAAKVGVDVVLLNPGLSAEQIAAAVEEQDVTTVVADDDLADRLADPRRRSRPAARRVRGARRRCGPRRRRRPRVRQGQPGALRGAPRRGLPRRTAAHEHGQGPQTHTAVPRPRTDGRRR